MKAYVMGLGLALLATAAWAQSQLPPDLQAAIHAQGSVLQNTPEVSHQLKLFHVDDPAPRGVVAQRDIAYGAHPQQKLDIFYAAPGGGGRGGRGGGGAPVPTGPRPVVIFIHGGEMQAGDKHGVGGLDTLPAWLVMNGFVAVPINYRLVPDAHWPTANEDIRAAINWVHLNAAQYGGDPQKVILWGHSSGANLVADYVSHPEFRVPGPDLVAAVISSGGRSFDINAYASGGGVYYGDDKTKYAERSATPGLQRTTIPLFINDAEFDPPNIVAANDKLKRALCDAGHCPEVFMTLAVQNHLGELDTVGTNDHQLTDPLLAFLKKHAQ